MPVWNRNRLTSELQIDYPIIQGLPWRVVVAKTDRSGLQHWRADVRCVRLGAEGPIGQPSRAKRQALLRSPLISDSPVHNLLRVKNGQLTALSKLLVRPVRPEEV
jgi:hypothetical protein